MLVMSVTQNERRSTNREITDADANPKLVSLVDVCSCSGRCYEKDRLGLTCLS